MKLKDMIVYALTKKPDEYVHVSKPKTLQDHRQVQYNNWCKAKGVYNGSYLPTNPDILSGRGWKETRGSADKSVRNFQRLSSGQMVRFDKESEKQYDHYHWKNATSDAEFRKKPADIQYKDRYGMPCSQKSGRHHLAPLDEEYHDKKK